MIALLLACSGLFCVFEAQMELSWEPSVGADSYTVYMVSTQDNPLVPPLLLASDVPCCRIALTRTWPDTWFPVMPGTRAEFAVSAVNEWGESAMSSPLGVVIYDPIYLANDREDYLP